MKNIPLILLKYHSIKLEIGAYSCVLFSQYLDLQVPILKPISIQFGCRPIQYQAWSADNENMSNLSFNGPQRHHTW